MDINFFSGIAQVISSLLTLATILFAWKEISELRKQTATSVNLNRALTYRKITEHQFSIWKDVVIENPEVLKWFFKSRGFEDHDNHNLNVIRMYSLMKFDEHENLHWEYSEKILPEEAWDGWKNVMAKDFSITEIKETWEVIQTSYSKLFRDFVNNQIIITPSEKN
jgi:hypothetical protein